MRELRLGCTVLGLAISMAPLASSGAPVITTLAGGGPNDLPALSANLSSPTGVAFDREGNLFIAVQAQPRVLKVDPLGQLTVVAGNGSAGFSGDGGPATQASIASVDGLALDADGNLFIADAANARVRRVDASTGVITTFAGNGIAAFSEEGVRATNSGVAPSGVAVDVAGNVFIADPFNHRVQKVDAVTGIMTTVAGDGTAGFHGDGGLATHARLDLPFAIALDAAGNLFVTDLGNFRVRRVDAATGVITTAAGNGTRSFGGDGGLATSASLAFPIGVALNVAGDLFIGDAHNQRIRRVDAITGIIDTVAGSGVFGFSGDGGLAIDARLADPAGVALDAAGNLFIGDTINQRVRRVDATSAIISTVAGNGFLGFGGDGGAADRASLHTPLGVALDAAGNVFVADSGNHAVRRVEPASGIITTIAGNGSAGFAGDEGPAADARLRNPSGVALDAAGNLFIADADNLRVRRVDAATGVITTVAGNGSLGVGVDGGPATSASLRNPSAVALDAEGNLFIAESLANRIRRVDVATGIITTIAGGQSGGFSGDGGPATSARLSSPAGIALDVGGDVLIADLANHRVRRVSAFDGIITTIAGDGTPGFSGDGDVALRARLNRPRGVALDAAGNLWIADGGNQRIRRVDASTGIISTVAGDGTRGFGGDDGEATSASLSDPSAIALGASATLLIADAGNHRIRRVGDAGGSIAIEIDIKPGSARNSINPRSEGVTRVAILGSPVFDVSEVDGATLSFGEAQAMPIDDLGDTGIFEERLEDVNRDGFVDLVAHFDSGALEIAPGDTEACLLGNTLDGEPFSGCDEVRTIPDSSGDRLR